MVIKACPECASTKLRMPGFQEGVVPETDTLMDYVCENGHKAVALEFDRRSDYEAFRDELTR